MKTIIFIGAPGSGKGSRIETCVKHGYTHISSGNLLRQAGFDLSSGKLIEDSIVVSLVKDAIEKTEGNIILDGFPRNVSQAEELEKQGVKVDKIIYIKISQKEAVKRAINRLICPKCQSVYTKTAYKPPKKRGICDLCGEKLIQRTDDNKETVRKRFNLFEEFTFPLLDFYISREVGFDVFDAENDEDDKILSMIEGGENLFLEKQCRECAFSSFFNGKSILTSGYICELTPSEPIPMGFDGKCAERNRKKEEQQKF